MRRRQFLLTVAASGAGALAGCSDPSGSISLTDVSEDATLADLWAFEGDQFGDADQRLIAGAVAEDPDRATVVDNGPPLEVTRPVAFEGRYYSISYSASNEREANQYHIDAHPDPDSPPDRTGSFEELPAVDREKLDSLLDPDVELSDSRELLSVAALYTPQDEAASNIVPDPAYDGITRGGRTFAIEVSDPEVATIYDYRYRAEALAADDSELATIARDRYRFQFDGLTQDQRSILDTAKNDEARSADPPSQAFANLVEKFRSHEGIEITEYDGTWLLRYDGEDWWADVTFPEQTPAPNGE
jgi:hypothetical protein